MSLTEDRLRSLPDPIYEMFHQLEKEAIESICTKLKSIGKLSESDTLQLTRLSDIGSDVNKIKKRIAETVEKSEETIYQIFYEASKEDYDFQKEVFAKLNKPWVPFEKNRKMMELVETISRATFKEFVNLSETTGFMGYKKHKEPVQIQLFSNSKFMALDEFYQKTIDYAVFSTKTGVLDYNSSMKKAIRLLADNGLMSGVSYDNPGKRPYHRRLDSSVRNAFMGAQQRLSRRQSEIMAELMGADGMEISWHGGARPSHVDFAGRQFTMKDYEQICVPLLGESNCYHRAFPIVIGVSTPTYSQKELDDLNAKELISHEFEGKTYNHYEATQIQRKLETRIRREKDRAMAFAISGDKESERISLAKTATLTAKYREFSEAVGLKTKPNRISVVNFTKSQAGKLGWETRNTVYKAPSAINSVLFANKISKQNNTTAPYNKAIIERFKNGTKLAQKVFLKHVPNNSVIDTAFSKTAHYSAQLKGINMNFADDLRNPKGAGVTYYHEHGHLIDMINGKPISTDTKFAKALRNDYNSYIINYMKIKGIKDKQDAYSAISNDIWSDEFSSVSDIMGGISGRKVSGAWGHDSLYWKQNPQLIEIEAFAHLYESQFDKRRLQNFQKYFPTATERFNKLLEVMK